MSDSVKIAVIVSAGIVIAVGLYVYFSPYQTCVRAYTPIFKVSADPVASAQLHCLEISN